MSEIWNLSTICRCCHSDGDFKSLRERYKVGETTEAYETLLRDVFAIAIFQIRTLTFEASYTICDECIQRLKDAASFKKQVLQCEDKFYNYSKNEQYFSSPETAVKLEDGLTHHSESDNDFDSNLDNDVIQKKSVDENINAIKNEYKAEEDIDNINNTQKEVKQISDSKQEIKHTVDTNLKTKIKNKDVAPNTKDITKEVKKRSKIVSKDNKINSAKSYKKANILHDFNFIKMINKTKMNNYFCIPCNSVLRSQSLMKKHIHLKHPELKTYKCEKCSSFFTTKDALAKHERLHENGKNRNLIPKTKDSLTCIICKKILCSRSVLRKHYQWHAGTNKSELCEICGHSFNDKTNLGIHIRAVHEKLRPFVCDFCGATYTAKKHLKQHIITHMLKSGQIKAPEKVLHTCAICNKMFKWLKTLKRHYLIHENKYQCTVCDTIFNDYTTYKSHKHPRSGMKYYCHICNKELASSYTLKRHIANHDDYRKFVCEKCPLGFNDKTQLRRHVYRVHIANIGCVKYQCLVCKRRVKDLDKHMLAHEVKKFNCPYCSSSYVQYRSLKRHITAIHSDLIISCDICHKKVISVKSLERHKSRVHKKSRDIDNTAV